MSTSTIVRPGVAGSLLITLAVKISPDKFTGFGVPPSVELQCFRIREKGEAHNIVEKRSMLTHSAVDFGARMRQVASR